MDRRRGEGGGEKACTVVRALQTIPLESCPHRCLPSLPALPACPACRTADAVCIINLEGLIQHVNAAFLRLLGYRKGELEGCNIMRLMPNPFSAQHDGAGPRLAPGSWQLLRVVLGGGAAASTGDMWACIAALLCRHAFLPALSNLPVASPCRLPASFHPAAGYLRNYATTRVARILDTSREVVALHKQRFVFGVNLCVTPITLGGEVAQGAGRREVVGCRGAFLPAGAVPAGPAQLPLHSPQPATRCPALLSTCPHPSHLGLPACLPHPLPSPPHHPAPAGSECFMGVVQPITDDPQVATAYCTASGSVVCVSRGFTNVLGWDADDIIGKASEGLNEHAGSACSHLPCSQGHAAGAEAERMAVLWRPLTGWRVPAPLPRPSPPLPCLQPFHSLSTNSDKVSQIVSQVVNGSPQERHDFGTIQVSTRFGEGGWVRGRLPSCHACPAAPEAGTAKHPLLVQPAGSCTHQGTLHCLVLLPRPAEVSVACTAARAGTDAVRVAKIHMAYSDRYSGLLVVSPVTSRVGGWAGWAGWQRAGLCLLGQLVEPCWPHTRGSAAQVAHCQPPLTSPLRLLLLPHSACCC